MINILEILNWEDKAKQSSTCNKIKNNYFGHQTFLLSKVFSEPDKSLDKRKYHSALNYFQSLGEEQMIKLISAPEMCFRLSKVSSDGILPVIDLINSDRATYLYGYKSIKNGLHGAWTAYGDKFIPRCNDFNDPFSFDSWLTDIENPFYANVTNEGFIIDTKSPFAKRNILANNFRPGYLPTVEMSVQEQLDSERKIFEASEYLINNCEVASEFSSYFTKVIMPRKDIGIAGFQGGSSRDFLGRINLINPHLEEITKDNVASSIVHESIHVFLYILEIWNRPSNNFHELYTPNKISPWTGQKIHLLAFIHASFVWYGLKKLWHKIYEKTGYSSRVSEYYLNKAVSGFSNKEYLKLIENNKDKMNKRLVEQLLEIPSLI